jgi:hypothetical protein
VIEKFTSDQADVFLISLKKLPAITVNKEYLSLRKQISDKTLFNEHLAVARGLIGFLFHFE